MSATATRTGHVAIISDLYAAFGRGDLDGLLAPLAADVSWDADWADLFSQRAGLGIVAPRHGVDGAREFFALVGTYVVHDFQVLDLMASDRQVTAQIIIELSYPNGGRYRDEELHLWRFNDDGKIAALRHYVDTAKHIAAWHGEDTTRRP
jgi:ketosteroid isomerase-like protein